MPFVPIPGCAKVELVGHNTTTLIPVVNVMHVTCPNPATGPELTAIANVFGTAIGGVPNLFASEMLFDYVRVTDLSTATALQVTSALTVAGSGAATNGPEQCVLTKLLTAERSRSGRGRIYWGLIPSTHILSNGAVDGYLQTGFSTLMANLETGLNALTPASSLAVGSRKEGLAHAVTSAQIEPLIGIQRRRVNR